MGDIGDYPGENPGDYIERGSYKGKDPVLDKNKRKLYSDTYKEKNKYARYYETETFFPRPDVERGPFNPNDFNQYKTKIERINFNFSNSAISYAMQDELLRVLKQNSIVVHVLQEETTRYQSRESGFFESFLDQLGGNALGSLFYKDKINTVKQKIGYSPNINIFSLFTNIKFGFAQAPYAKGARGNMIYYGKNNQNAFHFNVSNDNSNQSQTHYGAQISILNQWADLPLEEETVLASGIRVDVNEIRDNTGHLTWMSISYQKLQLRHFSYTMTNCFIESAFCLFSS